MGRQTEAMELGGPSSSPISSGSSSTRSSSSSTSTDGRAVTPPSSSFRPEVQRTIFNSDEVVRLFTCIWSKQPAQQYISHVNVSGLDNADRSVWKTQRGRELTGEVPRFFRKIFIEELSSAANYRDVRAACQRFANALRSWFLELEKYGRSTAVGKVAKNATALEIRHRVRSFRCLNSLEELGGKATKRNLYDLRNSMKEIWTLTSLSNE